MGWKSENEISIALKLKQVKSSIFKNSSNLICGFPRRPRKFLHLFRFLRLLFLVSWTTHKSTAERAWKVPQFYPLLLLHTPIPEETDCFRKLLLIDLKKTHPPQGICHTLVKQAEFKVDVWSTTVKRLPWWKRESRILATVTHIKVPFTDNCDDKLLVRKLFCRKKTKNWILRKCKILICGFSSETREHSRGFLMSYSFRKRVESNSLLRTKSATFTLHENEN